LKQAVRWLAGNLPLMIMALVLAALAWLVALEQADPTVERLYSQPVPITLTKAPEDLLIVGTFDERVQVTLRTTKSVWDSLRIEDFQVRADITGLGEGTHEVSVEAVLNREPARVVRLEPETVVIRLDQKSSRSVPVRVETEGTPALGYIPRAKVVEPTDVAVIGPTSYVTRVVGAFATLSIQDAQEDVEETLRIRPRDSAGDSVPYVSLSPDSAYVRIPIEPSGYHSTLAVKAVLTGEIESGYRVTDISIDPPTVTVFGNPTDLAALEQGFIETKPVDVGGAGADVVVQPGLNVPPKVTIVPGEQVKVRVFVEAIQSSLTITNAPEIQGLEPGYTATVSPDVVQVILNGPLPTLESLESDDVRVVLELFELPEGTHQIAPEVIAPNQITAQSVIPATVQVKIAEVPVPTPTIEAEGSVTVTATITSSSTITDQ
jgi:YbbR domain-containing protein